MTTGDVVYSLRFSLIKILPEPGFDLGSTAGESCVLTARLHMLDHNSQLTHKLAQLFIGLFILPFLKRHIVMPVPHSACAPGFSSICIISTQPCLSWCVCMSVRHSVVSV